MRLTQATFRRLPRHQKRLEPLLVELNHDHDIVENDLHRSYDVLLNEDFLTESIKAKL